MFAEPFRMDLPCGPGYSSSSAGKHVNPFCLAIAFRVWGNVREFAQTPARMTTLVLVAFAAVHVVWGSTYWRFALGSNRFHR
jgi:hypothetical protein